MPPSITVCTSFSPQGYELYGERFIETFLEMWPKNINLVVAYEHKKPPVTDPRVRIWNLMKSEHLKRFLHDCEKSQHRNKLLSAHHMWGASKWARKVFALSHGLPATDWWVWIDADVIHTAPITDAFLARVFPDYASLVYLGRQHWRYSECGFVGYRVTDPDVRMLLQRMRERYTSMEFLKLAEWGDSYVFDACRRDIFQSTDSRLLSLSSRAPLDTHVWPRTILADYMSHQKGRSRKVDLYGGFC